MEKDIYIKREKNVFLPENMLLGIGIFPAHATRDDESLFYGLTIEEADQLKELIPEGRITGDADIFSSRQFKFPSELPSGMMMYADGTVELWVEYASKRISISVPTREKMSIPGISEIKRMENFGNFEVDKIIEILEKYKDIILKVESGKGEDKGSISIYLNLGNHIEKQRLVEGITDMFNKFGAISTNLDYEKGHIRILKFIWTGVTPEHMEIIEKDEEIKDEEIKDEEIKDEEIKDEEIKK